MADEPKRGITDAQRQAFSERFGRSRKACDVVMIAPHPRSTRACGTRQRGGRKA